MQAYLRHADTSSTSPLLRHRKESDTHALVVSILSVVSFSCEKWQKNERESVKQAGLTLVFREMSHPRV